MNMIKILLVLISLIGIFTGVGIAILDKLNIERKGFAAPVGFVVFLTLLQLLYYPAQIFNLSFNWIIGSSFIVLIIGILLTLKNIKKVVENLLRKDTLIVLGVFIVFIIVFSKLFIDIEFSDSPMYLNYISQNINIEQLNMFNLYTGLPGAEWDGLYLYQGYFHFASFLCWLINIPFYLLGKPGYVENIMISTWGLGMLYSLISSMFIVNIIKYFKLKNKWFEFCLLFFTLFYSNFYYWRVAFSFYGNTFRTLLATMLIFYAYRWLKEENENIKYVIPFIVGAGLACSSSYLFISFAILYCLAVYLFVIKKERTFVDMSIFVLPIAIYATVMFCRSNLYIGLAFLIVFSTYYLGRFTRPIRKLIINIEEFLFNNAKLIFFIVVPVAAILFSAYINFFKPEYLYNYSYYFQDHQKYDMVKDYTFVYSFWIDNIMNALRWIGVILVIIYAKTKEDKFIKMMILLILFVFLNPLTTTAISYLIASNVFYRTVEVLFNPFTELILLIYIYQAIQWQKLWQWIFEFILIGVVVLGHTFSWLGYEEGLYTFYFIGGKNTESLYKIEPHEFKSIKFLQEELKNHPQDDQLTIISQVNGIRTFIPEAYQIFTSRDYFYPFIRVDWVFYDISRRHYDWEEKYDDIPYERACEFIENYNVDYTLIRYWENSEFDKETDKCMDTLFDSGIVKVKRSK